MRLEACINGNPNVGDDLNHWLWPQLLPGLFNESPEHVFLGVGTLLTKKRVEKQLAGVKTVSILSSGAWGPQAPKCAPNWKVYGVRGPRTAAWVGLDSSSVVGDGAYLLRRCVSPTVATHESAPIGFVPHHRSEDYINWEPICRAAGVQLISARQGVEPFIQQLTSCKLVVSEAMHGAIFADALRIPWLPAKFSPAFREDKWLDWADSMSLDLHFHILPAVHDKPFPLGKRLEKTFKQLMSRFKVSGKLPEQSWKSGPLEVAKLIQALRC